MNYAGRRPAVRTYWPAPSVWNLYARPCADEQQGLKGWLVERAAQLVGCFQCILVSGLHKGDHFPHGV